VLPTMVETIAQTLKLPYVAIALQQGGRLQTTESYGKPSTTPLAYPLTYQGEVIGQLLVARRAPDEAFTAGEERLLQNIARQAGTAVHALQLTADLQRARQQVVTSREEERRRLRRDLHDGLGPSLAAQILKLGSARALLAEQPEMSDKLLAEMETDIESTLADVRRIVYDLRPAEPGKVALDLVWQATSQPSDSYTVFVHVLDPEGVCCIWQQDVIPGLGTYPTDRWFADEVVVDSYLIDLPEVLLPGLYPIEIGLYLPDNGQRLLVSVPGLRDSDAFFLRPLEIQ